MRNGRLMLVALVAAMALVLVGCGGGGGGGGGDGGGGGGSTPTGSAVASSTESESNEPGVITITAPANASTIGYGETQVTATANTPFTIHFDNQDPGIPHNVVIYKGTDTSATPVFTPGATVFVTGPDNDDYYIPALEPGTYTFVCSVHPAVMIGTLAVA